MAYNEEAVLVTIASLRHIPFVNLLGPIYFPIAVTKSVCEDLKKLGYDVTEHGTDKSKIEGLPIYGPNGIINEKPVVIKPEEVKKGPFQDSYRTGMNGIPVVTPAPDVPEYTPPTNTPVTVTVTEVEKDSYEPEVPADSSTSEEVEVPPTVPSTEEQVEPTQGSEENSDDTTSEEEPTIVFPEEPNIIVGSDGSIVIVGPDGSINMDPERPYSLPVDELPPADTEYADAIAATGEVLPPPPFIPVEEDEWRPTLEPIITYPNGEDKEGVIIYIDPNDAFDSEGHYKAQTPPPGMDTVAPPLRPSGNSSGEPTMIVSGDPRPEPDVAWTPPTFSDGGIAIDPETDRPYVVVEDLIIVPADGESDAVSSEEESGNAETTEGATEIPAFVETPEEDGVATDHIQQDDEDMVAVYDLSVYKKWKVEKLRSYLSELTGYLPPGTREEVGTMTKAEMLKSIELYILG